MIAAAFLRPLVTKYRPLASEKPDQTIHLGCHAGKQHVQ